MPSALNETTVKKLADAIAEACVRVSVAQGPAALAKEFSRIAPDLALREALVRGGWYRLGGVVDAAGNPVADKIERWAEDEFAAHGDDMHAFADTYSGRGLRATHLTGKTHYWVAATGPGAADTVQVEIEELQELVCHTLFADDSGAALPAGIDELIDPSDVDAAGGSANQPLGMPFYQLRRVVSVADFLATMRAQKQHPQPVHRFVEAWEISSAGSVAHFSNHWLLAVREHLDRFRQTIFQATPIAAVNGLPPKFASGFGLRGRSLNDALIRFDRQAGYPMAWFFHMLCSRNVPHAVAVAVVEDMNDGFSYLPQRDLDVIRQWLHQPYGF